MQDGWPCVICTGDRQIETLSVFSKTNKKKEIVFDTAAKKNNLKPNK